MKRGNVSRGGSSLPMLLVVKQDSLSPCKNATVPAANFSTRDREDLGWTFTTGRSIIHLLNLHRIEISASVECVGLLLTAECNGSGGRCTEDDASLTRGGFLERFLLGDSRARGSKTEAALPLDKYQSWGRWMVRCGMWDVVESGSCQG
ncbi:uncharacterized protein H6S33_004685 [Morchella sextelata]|uniref:uncharacterized protein n=1 Tax=Morchella sextelata TaxID=1174677 RepID=UPI001D044D8F|nr:uncharacterized protein H6S33_004685 [Morchella sextelata]KAH0605463.1 hypothetical protein H6S33_004685 [Morchella sextelata]